MALDTQKEMSPEIEGLQGPKLQLIDNKNKNMKDMTEKIKKLNSVLHTQCRERSILEQRLTRAEKIMNTLGRDMEDNERLEKQQDRITDKMQQLEKCLKSM